MMARQAAERNGVGSAKSLSLLFSATPPYGGRGREERHPGSFAYDNADYTYPRPCAAVAIGHSLSRISGSLHYSGPARPGAWTRDETTSLASTSTMICISVTRPKR